MTFSRFITTARIRTWLQCLFLILGAVALGGGLTPQPVHGLRTDAQHEDRVREFVQAFNARDLQKMLTAVDEHIQWLSVDGTKVATETLGKQELGESMKRYFRSCPTCKSSLKWMQSSGSRVAAAERATWTGKNGVKAQSSLSVYEFKDNKIVRVYYFPAEAEASY